ncbi:MAG TPA: nuclear transport factor 2 family protein [Gemmataceae bacterium]|nr:nuclear transport factor 2 family protein [Gemmataceae bacterium]
MRTHPSLRPLRAAGLLALAVLLLGVLSVHAGRRWGRGVPFVPSPCPLEVVVPVESPEEAIRRVLDDQVKAWNRGDLEGFMAGYWKSPELTFSSGGDQTKGWQATFDRYRKRYQTGGAEMGTLSFSGLAIDLLGPDSAFVRGRWQLVRSKDRPGGIFTLIVRRFPEGWRIVHDHTSN